MSDHRPPGRPRYEDILTPTEWRVVDGVRHGLTGPQIAARRHVSPDAVKYHVKNVLQKLGLENRRALRRWSGVPQASALSGKEKLVPGETTLGPILQISRSVSDLAEAKRWFGDVLGLRLLYSFEKLVFFDCGGVRLLLEEAGDKPLSGSILYFRVEDIRAAHEDLKSSGVVFATAPHMIHRHADGVEEWLAFFNDPDGRPLAIMARVAP